jgi:hypothetical protein
VVGDAPAGTHVDDLSSDRSERWLPLLRSIAREEPRSFLSGHVDEGLAGRGDIDVAAPKDAWPKIVELFEKWALHRDFELGVVCPHHAHRLILVAVDSPGEPFFELELWSHRCVRGWPVVDAASLEPLTMEDRRGFRVLRPGAEGLLKLATKATIAGRPRAASLQKKQVADLLARDPDGSLLAAASLGRFGDPMLRAARAVTAGRWDRPAMLQVQWLAAAASVVRPEVMTRKLREKADLRRCALARTITHEARTPRAPLRAWAEEVAKDHDVTYFVPLANR